MIECRPCAHSLMLMMLMLAADGADGVEVDVRDAGRSCALASRTVNTRLVMMTPVL